MQARKHNLPDQEWRRWRELGREIEPGDDQAFLRLVSQELTPEEVERVVQPPRAWPGQEAVLAVHWHPESVPMELIDRRLAAAFPAAGERLIIPTQHNRLLARDGFAGAEVDCFAPEFRRKVQLLVHLRAEKLAGAGAFRQMLDHTFRYRQSQLFDYLATLLEPKLEMRLEKAVLQTGAGEELILFVRTYLTRLKALIERHEEAIPPEALRNKLVREWFELLRDRFDAALIEHAQALLRAVKALVKERFAPEYFFPATEVIGEVRALGGGVVIPHPEQFWPVLLADYDVDGIEVWNPQSREYTEFLIQVVDRHNRGLRPGRRPLLILMGDDCHMGEKVKPPRHQDREKAGREIGVQPAWDDPAIRRRLIAAGAGRAQVVRAYRERLA